MMFLKCLCNAPNTMFEYLIHCVGIKKNENIQKIRRRCILEVEIEMDRWVSRRGIVCVTRYNC